MKLFFEFVDTESTNTITFFSSIADTRSALNLWEEDDYDGSVIIIAYDEQGVARGSLAIPQAVTFFNLWGSIEDALQMGRAEEYDMESRRDGIFGHIDARYDPAFDALYTIVLNTFQSEEILTPIPLEEFNRVKVNQEGVENVPPNAPENVEGL